MRFIPHLAPRTFFNNLVKEGRVNHDFALFVFAFVYCFKGYHNKKIENQLTTEYTEYTEKYTEIFVYFSVYSVYSVVKNSL